MVIEEGIQSMIKERHNFTLATHRTTRFANIPHILQVCYSQYTLFNTCNSYHYCLLFGRELLFVMLLRIGKNLYLEKQHRQELLTILLIGQ